MREPKGPQWNEGWWWARLARTRLPHIGKEEWHADHLLQFFSPCFANSRLHKVYHRPNLFTLHHVRVVKKKKKKKSISAAMVFRKVSFVVVILAERVCLNSSSHHLSSPDGWSRQAAQTTHHTESTLSNVSALPSTSLSSCSDPPPLHSSIISLSFRTHLSDQIDFPYLPAFPFFIV